MAHKRHFIVDPIKLLGAGDISSKGAKLTLHNICRRQFVVETKPRDEEAMTLRML